jgi:epoxyqueuosine reductase
MALDVGFHAAGITHARSFVEAEQALEERYARGLIEGAGYDAESISRFTHPEESVPGTRSIIAVALSYLTDDIEQSRTGGGPRGWLARFARGLDYHDEVQERLYRLADAIEIKLGVHMGYRSFTDTGPLIERAVAMRAGLGSRGKNSCIYVGEYRSWVVLGELLVDVELAPDTPAPPDICGECEECMRACPTGAICKPYTIDYRICLSQATQSKGFIPLRLREKMGTRIYGCDTCQSVCPLNADAKPGNIDIFRPSRGLGPSPELIPLLHISQAVFNARVVPTTGAWIRRTRFRRNVAVALGNAGDPIAIPALTESLGDPEITIRAHSAWALGRIGTPSARRSLEIALVMETDDLVREEIQAALGR